MLTVVVVLFGSLAIAADAGSDRQNEDPNGPGKPSERNILKQGVVPGTWEGELGMQFRAEQHEDDEFVVGGEPEDSAETGWGYLELSWVSEPVYGTQVGLGGLAVTDLWQKDGFDGNNDIFADDAVFADRAKWTQGYLKHNITAESYLIAGRADDDLFGEPATGDGDYYQGLGLTIASIPRVTLRAHAVNEWLNDASPSWDFGGVNDRWAELREGSLEVGEDVGADTSSRFGSVAYTAMADIEAVTGMLTVSPYVQHHSDVATSLGTSVEAEKPVSDMLSLGLEGTWATHLEDTPDELWPHDEDFQQRLIRGYGKVRGVELGVGYYSISHDRIIFNGPPGSGQFERDFKDIYILDEMDPMEEDIGKYGEQQGGGTIFADASFSWGPVSLAVLYGVVDGAAADVGGVETDDGEGSELDVKLGFDISESLTAHLFYADVQDDFAGDGEQGYDMLAGALIYSF